MTESYPLKWPNNKPITKGYQRKKAQFATTMGAARDLLLKELKLLGARNVVISSNVATYRRGGQDIMYADQSAAKENPGVAVYYLWDGDSYCIACDKWQTVTDNLQALNKSINAIRGLDRWGTGDMVKAAFSGFKELPAPEQRNCWQVLGIVPTKNTDYINSKFRELAQKHHPDRGGNHQDFVEIQNAKEQALKFATH